MFEALCGNTDIKAKLTHLVKTNAVAHAYLIEGAQGSGKSTLVQCLLCGMTAGESPEVRDRVARGTCPDIHTLSPEKDHTLISVDQVREMLETLTIVPDILPFHAVIISPADAMNVNAQNALLKQLEEPYSNTFFFLLTENAAGLLPTIRSRVQLIRMERLSQAEIGELLQKKVPAARTMAEREPEAFAGIVRMADGVLGKGIRLLQENAKQSELYDTVSALLTLYANKQHAALYSAVCKQSKKKREHLQAFFALLLAGLRDLLLAKRNANGEQLFFTDTSLPLQLVSKLTTRRLMYSCDAVQTAMTDCERNGNTTLILTALANALCRTNF